MHDNIFSQIISKHAGNNQEGRRYSADNIGSQRVEENQSVAREEGRAGAHSSSSHRGSRHDQIYQHERLQAVPPQHRHQHAQVLLEEGQGDHSHHQVRPGSGRAGDVQV